MGNSFSKKGDMGNLLRHAAQTMTEFSDDYQEFAQWKKSTEGSLKMTQASIPRTRKCELEIIQERKSKRRYEPPRRQQRMEGDSSCFDYLPARISPSPNKRPRQLRQLPMTVQMTAGGKVSISKPDWMNASAEDRTLIQDWNSRVKDSKGTDDLVIPKGTKLLPAPTGDSKEKPDSKGTDDLVIPKGTKLLPAPTGDSKEEQRVRRKTPEMKEKDNKLIHFNPQNQFEGNEEPLEESA
jgi:hypothetical protein